MRFDGSEGYIMGRVWQLVKQGKPKEITLFTIDIFAECWTPTGRYADVINPRTGKLDSAPVYKIIIEDILQNFAALDLKDGSYAFYL